MSQVLESKIGLSSREMCTRSAARQFGQPGSLDIPSVRLNNITWLTSLNSQFSDGDPSRIGMGF
jgi:hypothetical protein